MFYTRVNFPFSPVTYSILLSFGPQEQASPTSSEASECHHAGTPESVVRAAVRQAGQI